MGPQRMMIDLFHRQDRHFTLRSAWSAKMRNVKSTGRSPITPHGQRLGTKSRIPIFCRIPFMVLRTDFPFLAHLQRCHFKSWNLDRRFRQETPGTCVAIRLNMPLDISVNTLL